MKSTLTAKLFTAPYFITINYCYFQSGYGDDEAVDAFGRIIKDRRGGEGSETNRFTSEQFDHQRQFGGGRSVVAGPRGDYRGDPANKTFRPQPPNFREERRDDWNYNNNRGSGRSDRREIANFSAGLCNLYLCFYICLILIRLFRFRTKRQQYANAIC